MTARWHYRWRRGRANGSPTCMTCLQQAGLMDAAYDAPIIRENSKSLGHVPIIEINPRRNTKLKEELRAEARRFELLHFERPEDRRYKERTTVERVYGRLKDEFGGRMVRVRGHAKVMTHLPAAGRSHVWRVGSNS